MNENKLPPRQLIFISASEVAAAIGKNKYRLPKEIETKVCANLTSRLNNPESANDLDHAIKMMAVEFLRTPPYQKQIEELAKQKITMNKLLVDSYLPNAPAVLLASDLEKNILPSSHSSNLEEKKDKNTSTSIAIPIVLPNSVTLDEDPPVLHWWRGNNGATGNSEYDTKLDIIGRELQRQVVKKLMDEEKEDDKAAADLFESFATSVGASNIDDLKTLIIDEQKKFDDEREQLFVKFRKLRGLKRKLDTLEEVPRLIEEVVAMKMGVLEEKNIIEEVERYTQSFVSATGTSARIFHQDIPVNAYWSIRLTGKPDGIIRCTQHKSTQEELDNNKPPLTPCSSSLRNAQEKEEDILVEVKNRQSRIFKFVPFYELVQVCVYLYLTGIKKCLFVENFGGDCWKTIIVANPLLIEIIKGKLIEFADRCINKMIFESTKQLPPASV